MTRTVRRRAGQKATYHHGDLRNALIEAALALIAEGSPRDLSLREVARRAGVTYAAPYHHFPDKAALLAAVAREGFEKLIADLERAAARRATLAAEMQAMAEAYVGFAVAHPSHYRVMFLPETKESAEAEALHAVGDRAFRLLQDRVARARTGETEQQHRLLAATVWAALHGLSLLAIDGVLESKFPQPEKAVRQACLAIMKMVPPSASE